MSSTNTLDRAIELVRKAIDEDTKHNYSEALKYYQNALDYFMVALKYEKNEQSRLLIRAKINEYLTRAEKLKDFLITQNRGRTTTGVNKSAGGGGATGSTWKSKEDGANTDEGLEIGQSILTVNVNVKRNEAAFLDGADDDVARLDGAGDDKVRAADLDGAGGDDGDPEMRHLIVTEELNVKPESVADLDGAKVSSNESSQTFTCKRPIWKRIFTPSRSQPRDEKS